MIDVNPSPLQPNNRHKQQTPQEAGAATEHKDQQVPVAALGGSGWGDHLLPYLFIGMETCWIDSAFIALASINILGTNAEITSMENCMRVCGHGRYCGVSSTVYGTHSSHAS